MNKTIPRTVSMGLLTLLAGGIIVWPAAYGDDQRNKDLQERIRQDAKTHDMLQQEKDREKYRDHTHDGRVMVGKDSSVGGKVNGGGGSVDYRTHFK